MAALGDRPIREIEVGDIERFLGELDRNAAISPRSVNKYRQILSAIFGYARRPTTYALTANPGRDKRREPPPRSWTSMSPRRSRRSHGPRPPAAIGAHAIGRDLKR